MMAPFLDWLHEIGPERTRWVGLALGLVLYNVVREISERMEGGT